jgi:hypothetical protein
MRTLTSLGRLAVLGAALLVLTGSKGIAQEFKGKFTLPVEARWGSVDLRPGDYTLVITPELNVPLVRVTNKSGKTMFVIAMIRDDRPASEHSMLTLTIVGGKYFIRTLEAGDVGQVLTFRVSSHAAPELAQNRKPDMHLFVTGLGK